MLGKHSTTSVELVLPSLLQLPDRVSLLINRVDSHTYHCPLVFQLAYTTLFGWFTAYIFVRTGSAYVACFSHIFCNFMGLPTIGRDLREHPRHTLSEVIFFPELRTRLMCIILSDMVYAYHWHCWVRVCISALDKNRRLRSICTSICVADSCVIDENPSSTSLVL